MLVLCCFILCILLVQPLSTLKDISVITKTFVKDVCVVFEGNKLEALVKLLLLVAT